MIFRTEFQPAAIAQSIETATTFNSVAPYLRRLNADIRTELDAIDEAVQYGIPFVRQVAPARAAACYTALIAIQQAASDLGITDLAVDHSAVATLGSVA